MEELSAMALVLDRPVRRWAVAFIVAMWLASAWLFSRAIGLKRKSQICICGIEGCLVPKIAMR
jgi:hypothetical protein